MNSAGPEEVQETINELVREQKEMIKNIHQIMWYMRGSMSRNDAWTLSVRERKLISKLIDEKVKSVKESGLPIL